MMAMRIVAAVALLLVVAMSAVRADDGSPGSVKPADPNSREALAQAGFEFYATYIGEVLGNPTGGIRNGTIYTGRLDLGMTLDLDKIAGWSGTTFHTNFFQIHGNGLSRSYIGNLMLVSGVEALPATRLYELWIEKKFMDDRVAVRIGQQASDVEFFDSSYDDIFINSALGWPGITGINLPGGGPSPPLAVPGVRVKAKVGDRLTAYFAAFNGSPAAPGPQDPQIGNPDGLLFRVNDPPWLISQLKYRFPLGTERLPGTITGGAWYHFDQFADQRHTSEGNSIADPAGSGIAAALHGDQGVFILYEQMLAKARQDASKGLAFFVRASVSPSDRNLVDAYVDGGLLLTGFSEVRPNDKIGVAATWARISRSARALDRDTQMFVNPNYPIRDFEAVIELTYQAEIRPGFLFQPVLEYVIHPGGGAVDPNDRTTSHRIKDAFVMGVRTTLTY